MKLSWGLLILSTLCVSLCSAGLVGQAAKTIVTTNTTTGEVTSYDAQSITSTCTETDSTFCVQVQGFYYVTECLPPTYPFDVTAKTTVPSDVYIYSILTCQVDAAADVNQSTTVFIPGANGARRLLSIHDTDPEGRQGWASRTLQSSPDAGDAWGCLIGNCDGFKDSNAADISILKDQMNAQIYQASQQQYWDNNVTVLLKDQTKLNANLRIDVDATNKTLVLLNKQIGILEESQQALALHADQRAAAIQGDLNYLANQTAAGLAAVTFATDGKLALLQDKFINSTNSVIALINTLTAQLNENQQLTDKRLRSGLRFIRKVQTDLYSGLAGTNTFIDTTQLRQIAEALGDAVSRGRVPMLDPNLPGSPPSQTLTASDLTSYIDLTRINYINFTSLTGGILQIHQFGINFYCNLAAILRMGVITAQWDDILDLVGPPNCTVGVAPTDSPVTNCKCWVETAHSFCPMPPSSTFRWEQVTTVSDRTAYDLTASMCLASAQPTVDPVWNRRVDALSGLHDALGAVCRSKALVSGSSFKVVSIRQGPISVPANYSDSVCDVDLYELFQRPNVVGQNLIFALYQQWILGVGQMVTERNLVKALATGVRPRGLTNTFLPFTVLSNGRSYSCFETGITTFSPTTEIVYRLQPTGNNPRVSIKVYDQPPDCVTTPGVCVPFGNLISSQTTASVTLTPPEAGILPVAETVIVGELLSSGMTQAYDIPSEAISMAPDARSQAGHVTYTAWSFLPGYSVATNALNPPAGNLNHWEADHPGNRYDHFASVSAGYYRRAIVQGQVVPVAGQELNFLGKMLNAMVVDGTTNMRQGRLVLTPRTWSYVSTFDAVIGPLIIRVQSGCPDISYNPDDISGRVVTLKNGWPFPVAVAVTRSNADPTCPAQGDLEVTIDPSDSYPIIIPTCGNYTLQVFKVGTDILHTRTACADPLTTILQRVTQSNIAVSNLINQTKLAVSADLDKAVASTQLGILLEMISVITTALPNVALNITASDLSGTGNSTLSNIIANLQARASGVDLISNSAVAAIAPFTAQLDSLRNDTLVQLAIVSTAVTNVGASVAQVEADQQAQEASNNVSKITTAAFIAQTQRDHDDLISEIAASTECTQKPWALDRVLCTLYQALSTILILAVVVLFIAFTYRVYKACSVKNDNGGGQRKSKKNKPKYRRVSNRGSADEVDLEDPAPSSFASGIGRKMIDKHEAAARASIAALPLNRK